MICILFGWRQWNLVPVQDYLLLAAMSVTQYLVSLDKIFYACLVLPLLISYYALRRNFLQFCWLTGLLVLFCCIYMTLPLAGEFWSKNDIYILSKISSYRLSLGIYLTVFLFVCEIYINNRRLYKALERLTFNDELTSLRTRRYVKKLINHDKLQEGSAILLDIDNFKQVNDQYGHAVGDQVLRHMAQLLRQAAPATAVVSRWGGEEFLVLLPKHDQNDCIALCQRILRECQRLPFKTEELCLNITFSMGRAPLRISIRLTMLRYCSRLTNHFIKPRRKVKTVISMQLK
ncbi:GGDEF domain-containing protein [Acinetobacter thermotolerans]|uniref:GGDEF domain-containing protein n=1 Tax=Acinetobacter thermotolerans TaxID=3151487 RepID=UPI00325B18E7